MACGGDATGQWLTGMRGVADGSGGNGDKEGMARAKGHAQRAEIHRDGAEDRRHQKEEERDQRQRVERACPTGNGAFEWSRVLHVTRERNHPPEHGRRDRRGNAGGVQG